MFSNKLLRENVGIPLIPDNSALLDCLSELDEFYFYPNPGNLGDAVIAQAEYQLFDRLHCKYTVRAPGENDPVLDQNGFTLVYGGGGRFVKYWKYQDVFPVFQHRNMRRVIVLPSSFWECDDFLALMDERFTIFCRQEESYQYGRSKNNRAHFLLADDMAASLVLGAPGGFGDLGGECAIPESCPPPGVTAEHAALHDKFLTLRETMLEGIAGCTQTIPDWGRVAFFLRSDAESGLARGGDLPASYDVSWSGVGPWLDRGLTTLFCALFISAIDTADLVVTDRLHVGITAALLRKNVFFLDNNFGKIRGVYTRLFRHIPHLRLLTGLHGLPAALADLDGALPFSSDMSLVEKEAWSFSRFMAAYLAGQRGGRPHPASVKIR